MYHTVIPVYNGSFTVRFGDLSGEKAHPLLKFENISSFFFLVIDENGDAVIVDTGFSEDHIPGQGSFSEREPGDDIVSALERHGVRAANVRSVVMTHIHWDHTGGMSFFPNAEFYVQSAEFTGLNNLNPHEETYYCPAHWMPLLDRIRLIKGSCLLKPGFELIYTGDHSFGHQLARVSTRGGRVLIAGDATLDYSLLWKMVPDAYWAAFRSGPGKRFYWMDEHMPAIRVWLRSQNPAGTPEEPSLSSDEIRALGDTICYAHDPRLHAWTSDKKPT